MAFSLHWKWLALKSNTCFHSKTETEEEQSVLLNNAVNCHNYIVSVADKWNTSTKHWWNASKLVHLKTSELFMYSIIHLISDRPILNWHHIWLENLVVSFVCNACANTYVSLCFETRLFPNLRQLLTLFVYHEAWMKTL